MSQICQVPNSEEQSFAITPSKLGKDPIMEADIMKNDVADQPSSGSSMSQISEVFTSKEEPFTTWLGTMRTPRWPWHSCTRTA